jgi:hypothetical protein
MKCKGKNIAVVGDEIVKTNIYRCTEYCPNCPFLDDGRAVHLNDGRVDDIKEMLLKDDNNSFTCHKTAYNLDNNNEFTEEQDPKMCKGAYEFLIKEGRPNIMMRIAMAMGVDKENIAE